MTVVPLSAPILRRAEQIDMPVLYAQACRALEACITMDEAKYYADKSDALAAWAKIYGSDADKVAAVRLKNHAFARMGQLAQDLRPQRLCTDKGPKSLLMEHGLSENNAQAARKLAKLNKEEIDSIAVAPSTWSARDYHRMASGSWKVVAHSGHGSPISFRTFCRQNDPTNLAKGISHDEAKKASVLTAELLNWLIVFQENLSAGEKHG